MDTISCSQREWHSSNWTLQPLILSHMGLLPPTEPWTESLTSALNTWKPPCHTSSKPLGQSDESNGFTWAQGSEIWFSLPQSGFVCFLRLSILLCRGCLQVGKLWKAPTIFSIGLLSGACYCLLHIFTLYRPWGCTELRLKIQPFCSALKIQFIDSISK